MIIYLLRHAVAMERDEWDGSDEGRPLTQEGIERMREAARGLAKMQLSVDLVFTSSLTRARQTAEIFTKELGLAKATLMEELSGGQPPAYLLKKLADFSGDEKIALVGHEPDMSEYAAFFLGTARALPFKKGAVMAIEFDGKAGQGKGRLIWYMPTKVMRHLA